MARVAVPVAAVAAGVAVTASLVGGGDASAPTPAPQAPVASSPPPDQQAAAGAATVAPAPAPAPVRTYVNPVFDKNAPDPSIVRADDGTYYAYTTETAHLPFQVLRSEDLTSWERVGGAFKGDGPDWIASSRWAPDVKQTGDHYTMTYSGRGHDGRMRIGYATADEPKGPFTDRGILAEGDSVGYFIDPYLLQANDGSWKLYYGSTGGNSARDQSGITAVDVDIAADGSMSTRGAGHVVVSEAGERVLVEGAWVHERNGQYFLFYSDGAWDAKGGANDYALKVARSSSPDGPFEKHGDAILRAGSGYTSTGHNSIVTDDAGTDWVVYHAWDPDPTKGRVLMMDPIEWRNGWPVVNGGKGPSTTAMVAPVIQARDGVRAVGE